MQDDVVVVVELVAEFAPPSAFSGATVAETGIRKGDERVYTYLSVGSSPWQSRPKYPVGSSFC